MNREEFKESQRIIKRLAEIHMFLVDQPPNRKRGRWLEELEEEERDLEYRLKNLGGGT